MSALSDQFRAFPLGLILLSLSHTHTRNFVIGIEYIKVPTWLFHGGNDGVVPINTSLQIMHRYVCLKREREKGERWGERGKREREREGVRERGRERERERWGSNKEFL